MSDIYQIVNIGLVDATRRMEAISLNAASASLHGYRRHVVAGSTFATLLTANEAGPVQGVDLRRGSLISTDRALDLAIDADDAFFALSDGTQTWLTRSGEFRVDESGAVLGEGGLRVMGVQGELRVPGSDVTVGTDGSITQQGVVVGTVQLLRPVDHGSLRPERGSLMSAPGGVQAVEPGTVRIRSGALEASNTDAAREMLGLMQISRQFESLSRVLQAYDELLGRAIQKITEV